MNKKTVTLTAVERSYLIIELQKNLSDLIKRYHASEQAGDGAAYYHLADAKFVSVLLAKIKGDDERLKSLKNGTRTETPA